MEILKYIGDIKNLRYLHLTNIKLFVVVSQIVDSGCLEVRDGHLPLIVDRGGAGGHGTIAEKRRRDGGGGPALRSLEGIGNIQQREDP